MLFEVRSILHFTQSFNGGCQIISLMIEGFGVFMVTFKALRKGFIK
jgi:hypothetical protein